MKLHLASLTGFNQITGYGSGYVAVNNVRHEKSLVVMPNRIIEERLPRDFSSLSGAHFEFLRGLEPEIVLLGTGAVLRFPAPALARCLLQARIGLEVMDTGAACRTYNILTAEGRCVAAAILLG